MPRTFHRKQSMSSMSEINITPLLDLAFALLIIFMITTPLLEQTIPLDLPKQDAHARPSQQIEYQTVSIDRNGQIHWGKEPVSLEQLDQLLANLARDPNPPVLNIRSDSTNTMQPFIDVLDKIKVHQLTRISIDTRVR